MTISTANEEVVTLKARRGHRKANGAAGKIVIDPKAPLSVAREYLALRHHRQGMMTLRYWQGDFLEFNGACYAIVALADIRAAIYHHIEGSVDGKGKAVNPKRGLVDDVVDALRAASKLNDSTPQPAIIGDTAGDLAPSDLIACANGLLHLPTRRLLPSTPALFVTNALDFAYDASASTPTAWLQFLDTLWPGDMESQETLQEWCGLCLTLDTSFQKAMMLIGPRRSGKGTIARILTRLVGAANSAAPTLANIGSHFGLQSLIGKQLAVISDARLGRQTDIQNVAENLLRISGEDNISIPRKHREDYTAKLPTRFMVLSNELPSIGDSSGALASRFIMLALTESFLGREDRGLTARLEQELPGVLLWSLEGLERLRDRGYFRQPAGAQHLAEQMEALGSPIKAFIEDRCVVDPGQWVECKLLYEEWIKWCRDEGRDHEGTLQGFGRALLAALPHIRVANVRVDGGRRRRYQGVGLSPRGA